MTTREMLEEVAGKTGGRVSNCQSCKLDYIVHNIHLHETLCIACSKARPSMNREHYGIMHPQGRKKKPTDRKRGRPMGSTKKVLEAAR